MNGSIREYFSCSHYVGIDWREGQGVDLVCLAHKAPFEPETFDTVVSASMLEHDPHWRKSIAKMVSVLKPGGLLAISWGTALNPPHHASSAPDGKFHALKAGLALRHLKKLEMHVHTFLYERRLLEQDDNPEIVARLIRNKEAGTDAVALVAFKDSRYAIGRQCVDTLLDEDKTGDKSQ